MRTRELPKHLDISYLRWAKVHRPVRFELTGSGAPHATLQDFEPTAALASLAVHGAYGDEELIEAIAARYGFAPSGIVPVCGASSAIFVALASCADPGDAIAIEQPGYEPVERVAKFLELKIVRIRRDPADGFVVQMKDVEEALAAGVRAVVLTNLHNPSGQLLPRNDVERIAGRLCDNNATLIVDEVYLDAAHLNAGHPRWTAASLGGNVVTVNSLTKIHGLGPLRVGWVMGSDELAEKARDVVDLLNADFPAPSSDLAIQAFGCIERFENRYRALYQAGEPVFRRWLAEEPLVAGYESFGALFELVRLPAGVSSRKLNELLVAELETQVVPGAFFGLDDHIRLSLAVPVQDLDEALGRVSRGVRRLADQR